MIMPSHNSICAECGGACCKIFNVQDKHYMMPAAEEWMRARGALENARFIGLLHPCPLLDEDGRCKNYRKRPDLCRAFSVNSKECIACQELINKKVV